MNSNEIISWKELPLTEANKTKLEQLKPEDGVIIVRMKRVNGNKVQIEFAQKIILTPGGKLNILAMLNKSDERFTNSGPTRAWMSAEPADLKRIFGIEMPEGESYVELMQPVPTVDGMEFGLQITECPETQLPKNLQGEYLESNLKRTGKNGEYFYMPNGERVGRYSEFVAVEPGTVIKHSLVSNATIGQKPSDPDIAAAAGIIQKPGKSGLNI